MRRLLAWIIILVLCVTGCKGKALETSVTLPEPTATPTPTPTPEPTATPEPTPDISNLRPSTLTGELIDMDVAARRPVAVVINNMRKSLPQSGVSQAGVIYEVLAEGDITRMIAVFDDFDSEKIGTVRSTRDYFADFALNHDALYVHHGGSPTGYAILRQLKMEHLDGQVDDGAFWRDPVRFNTPGMYEHSSYTSAKRIWSEAERQGMRLTLYEDGEWGWGFNPVAALPQGGAPANKITVPFSQNYAAVFEYDTDTKTYRKYLGQAPQMDEETDAQLTVTNVLVQLVNMHIIAGDEADRRSVELIGSGEGYIITGGEYAPVRWEKKSHQSPTQWYSANGGRLRLNTGKTWICVYKGDVIFE